MEEIFTKRKKKRNMGPVFQMRELRQNRRNERLQEILIPSQAQAGKQIGKEDVRQMDKTFIVLIPKVDAPENLSHFRPLCNLS
jgi:hypothetical protein